LSRLAQGKGVVAKLPDELLDGAVVSRFFVLPEMRSAAGEPDRAGAVQRQETRADNGHDDKRLAGGQGGRCVHEWSFGGSISFPNSSTTFNGDINACKIKEFSLLARFRLHFQLTKGGCHAARTLASIVPLPQTDGERRPTKYVQMQPWVIGKRSRVEGGKRRATPKPELWRMAMRVLADTAVEVS
jgi:hypothetical protein